MTADFASPGVLIEGGEGGALLLRSSEALGPFETCTTESLCRWAKACPGRVFLTESETSTEVQLSYGQALEAMLPLAGALLQLGLGPERPLVVVSDNSIENALLQLAAQHVGIAVAPISPAFAGTGDHGQRLAQALVLLKPALVYLGRGLVPEDVFQGSGKGRGFLILPASSTSARPGGPLLEKLFAFGVAASREALINSAEEAHRKVGPDTLAKLLFTSGSTGESKAVINTHRMLCANQQMISQLWPFLRRRPPQLVDWLPWHHTFGGNHNFNMVIKHGGTLHIDSGKPALALLGRTLARLREHAPTLYFNVPRGFDLLLPHLRDDEALADHFFSRLEMIFYAGAALSECTWRGLKEVAAAARARAAKGATGSSPVDHEITMASAWGATETAPMVTAVHFPIQRSGVIGLPAPGVELKLAPDGDKFELRVRGPNVTPGYFKRPDLSHAAFDDEGFYRTGDGGIWVDESDPNKGLAFDGRIGESFKLSTGTWVHASMLRLELCSALSPWVADMVLTGHDGPEVGALLFPVWPACRQEAGLDDGASPEQVLESPRLRHVLCAALALHNKAAGGSSRRLGRAILLEEPASLNLGEITDKGYLNQRLLLKTRSDEIRLLYSDCARVLLPRASDSRPAGEK